VTGPAGPTDDGPRRRRPDDSNHPALVAGRERRASPGTIRGRWAAVITVVAVVTVVAVISAVLPAPTAAPAAGLYDGVAIPPAGSYSSSAFCTAGSGTAAGDTIFLTNSTSRAVTGVATTVGTATAGGSVPSVRSGVSVPAFGSGAFDPSAGLPAGDVAASFVFDGGGVVAQQVVSGPNGWSMAPCASQASPDWSFAGGSTTAGNTLSLSLLNPSSTEAVVDISFLTASGKVSPQSYQGLVVPPGQLVVENVGDFVQNASAIATLVSAESGSVVSSQFQQWGSGATGGLSVQLGAPEASTVWRFAQTTTQSETSAPGSSVDFTLANPGAATATATIVVGLPSGSVVPKQVAVAPSSTVVFAASGANGLPEQVPYSLTVESDAPIVVGRTVQAPAGAQVPVWGSSAGTVTLANRWLVPGPGEPGTPGTPNAALSSLAVANPGPSTARVTIADLGSNHPLAVVTVGVGRLVVLGHLLVGGLKPLTVSATEPVNVEQDSWPTGGPGVVSSAGFPVVG
jgi:hypothetical protein